MSVPPDRDRNVGRLDPPTSAFPRSDSEASATSTHSVPRSSSFTRSRRFLTGDGLSSREALGVIDSHPDPALLEAVNIVRSYDLARSAMYQVFRFPSSEKPPPPPKVDAPIKKGNPPPPPPIAQKIGNRQHNLTADDDDLSKGDDKENKLEGSEATSVPSSATTPIAHSAQPLRSLLPEPAPVALSQSNSALSDPLIPTKGSSSTLPSTPSTPKALAPNSDSSRVGTPNVSPLPKSKTIARIKGFFSPSLRAEHSPTDNTQQNAQDTNSSVERDVKSNAPDAMPTVTAVSDPAPTTQQTAGTHCPAPSRHAHGRPPAMSATFPASRIPAKDFSRPASSTVNRRSAHPNAFHISAAAATQPKAIPNPASTQIVPDTTPSVNVQNTSSAESAAAIKKETIKRRTDLFRRFKMIQDRAKFDVGSLKAETIPNSRDIAQDASKTKPNSVSDKPPIAEAAHPQVNETRDLQLHDDSISNLSAGDESSPKVDTETPTEENKSLKVDAVSEVGSSPDKLSLAAGTVESMTTSSSGQSRGDRSCSQPGIYEHRHDTYNNTSSAPVQAQGTVATSRMSQPFSYLGMPASRTPPVSSVNAHDFLDGPIHVSTSEDQGQERLQRKDSHTAYIQSLERKKSPDTAPASIEERGDKSDSLGERETATIDVVTRLPDVAPLRKTKSGLQRRLAKAKDAGAGMVARAKKVPRGATFPKLRSSGDAVETDMKPAEVCEEICKVSVSAFQGTDGRDGKVAKSEEGKQRSVDGARIAATEVERNAGADGKVLSSPVKVVDRNKDTRESASVSVPGSSGLADTPEKTKETEKPIATPTLSPIPQRVTSDSEKKQVRNGPPGTKGVVDSPRTVSSKLASRVAHFQALAENDETAQKSDKGAVKSKESNVGEAAVDKNREEGEENECEEELVKGPPKLARKLSNHKEIVQPKAIKPVLRSRTLPNVAGAIPKEGNKVGVAGEWTKLGMGTETKAKMCETASKVVEGGAGKENGVGQVGGDKEIKTGGKESKRGKGVGVKSEATKKEKEKENVGTVTIERKIRRVKRDGTEEVVVKKMRLKPERMLSNGDVVVRRTMKRMKEDGSGMETLTVMQVIPRRKKVEKRNVGGDVGKTNGESGEQAKQQAVEKAVEAAKAVKKSVRAEEPKVEVDERMARVSERSTSLPSGSVGRQGGAGDVVPATHEATATVHVPRSNTVGNTGAKRVEDVKTKALGPDVTRRASGFRRSRSAKIKRSRSAASSERKTWLGFMPRVISFQRGGDREDGGRSSGGGRRGFGRRRKD